MKSLTFILPVRIDNADRWNNLLTCLQFLTQSFPDSEIILIEDSSISKCATLSPEYKIRYLFKENAGNFSRSNSVNSGIMMATRKFVVVYDIDILILKSQILKAVKILEKGRKFIILPHNSIFVNVSGKLKDQLVKDLNLKIIPIFSNLLINSNNKDISLYSHLSGVVMFNKKLLIKLGGFNKKMISYGWEDIEILKRAAKLGIFYYSFSSGNIIHLDHARGTDSAHNEYYHTNKDEFLHAVSMNRNKLLEYIRNELVLDPDNVINQTDIDSIKRSNIINMSFVIFFLSRMVIRITRWKFKVQRKSES